jgi:hypothetical protein
MLRHYKGKMRPSAWARLSDAPTTAAHDGAHTMAGRVGALSSPGVRWWALNLGTKP